MTYDWYFVMIPSQHMVIIEIWIIMDFLIREKEVAITECGSGIEGNA